MKNIQNKKRVASIIEQNLIIELDRLRALRDNLDFEIEYAEGELEKFRQKKAELYS